MADVVGVLLKKMRRDLMKYYSSSITAEVDSKRLVAKSSDQLMNHLRNMMIGYENEQVQDLFKEMDGLLTGEALESPEETLIRYGNEDTEETGISGSWYKHEEKIMDRIIVICEQLCNIRYNSKAHGNDDFVGFDKEVETLLDQLTGTSTKQLQIISIAGMAGLGKTTLARILYNHPLIEYLFDFRAWTCVSRVFLEKDVLRDILCSFTNSHCTKKIEYMNNEQLGEKVYRLLKGRKYLLVLDDIWDCKPWIDIRMYFPDDKIGSRIIFTSRDVEVNAHVQSALVHVLRHRTDIESWMIFLKKVFRTGICPGRLESLGCAITDKCEGLPLSIVIASGILKNNLSSSWWQKISSSLRSFIVSDPNQYMHSLTLSYDHLPPHLRPCFLYFGAFPEDYEVSVTKLIWLWIAQGFIHETGGMVLEDVAMAFLMDLIKRSLVMTLTIKDDGQVKTCRIHDLLHNFCLKKSEEKAHFLSKNSRYGLISSMLCSPLELGQVLQKCLAIDIDTYKFLLILDVGSITISSFPSATVQLVSLRYLAVKARDGSPVASISNLVKLQMLIISSRKNVLLPKTIWNMVNLRHLYLKSGENLLEDPCSLQPSVLASMQTLSQVSPRSFPNILSKTPNLRKLGFCGPLISTLGDLEFSNLGSMQRLEKLKLFNTFTYHEATRSCNPIMFPETLKKLTLSNTGMDWEEMWTFSLLPNLEVLKLKFNACIGERWETGDAEFGKLKVLKLQDLSIRHWISSRDNFPKLQRLLVRDCLKLNCIPLGLGKILTLDVIELSGCSASASRSAKDIRNEQEGEGNYFLKVHVNKVPFLNMFLKDQAWFSPAKVLTL